MLEVCHMGRWDESAAAKTTDNIRLQIVCRKCQSKVILLGTRWS